VSTDLHLGVALDGYGWHRRAWRNADESALSGGYWAALAATAERGLLDFLTIDDDLTPQPGRREALSPGRLAGRADAVMVAARVASATRQIGLIPVATATHTAPVNIAKAIATLDAASHGRAGWQVRVSSTTHEAALFGRRDSFDPSELFDEATQFVEVVRRLWDGAERDQPVVAALAHAERIYQFAAATSDLVFITPHDDDELRAILTTVNQCGGEHLRVYADVVVTFGGDTDFGSDAVIISDGPAEVAELIIGWHDLGVDGVRLRPAVNAADLPVIVDEVVPLLQATGRFRTQYQAGESLRQRLDLPIASHRYTGGLR
jgi:alkanesulfonate monooxygenase SsuD/methylene tetrahydromethanopterin reductase-like flavin-dependent oxidoreductase (luciferase family)